MTTDITQSEVYERLIGACIRFVSYRPRSSKEITDFIVRKLKNSHTTAPLVTQKVLERLTELGYVDDHAFGIWWVEQRTGRNPKGLRAIQAELHRKGIAPHVIDEVVKTVMQEARSEPELARAAAGKKLDGVWGTLPKIVQKQKLSQYLLRRGFASEIVWGVVDDVIENV